MKKTIVLTCVYCFSLLSGKCFSQNAFGFQAGGVTKGAWFANVIILKRKNGYSLGLTYKPNDAQGKKETDQLPNYGRTTNGSGNYFYTVDFGYTRVLSKQFYVNGELSLGANQWYQNYLDGRFTDGGYHMIYKSDFLIGFGAYITYKPDAFFGLIGGYNTTKQAIIGIGFYLTGIENK